MTTLTRQQSSHLDSVRPYASFYHSTAVNGHRTSDIRRSVYRQVGRARTTRSAFSEVGLSDVGQQPSSDPGAGPGRAGPRVGALTSHSSDLTPQSTNAHNSSRLF